MTLLRLLAGIFVTAALTACSAGMGADMGCPGLSMVLPLTLIAPAPGATNVSDSITAITVAGSFGGSTQAIVTLTPSVTTPFGPGGGGGGTITDPIVPIPQPSTTQYNLAIPSLAAHTTYTVAISVQAGPGPCPIGNGVTLGSFTTL